MNLRIILGIVLSIMGGAMLINALFVEDIMYGEKYILSAVRLAFAFAFFGAAYYFGFKPKKELTKKMF